MIPISVEGKNDEQLAAEILRLRRLRVACTIIACATEQNRPKGRRERLVPINKISLMLLEATLGEYIMADDPEAFVVAKEAEALKQQSE